jgi:hypothetical protein
MNEKLDPFEFFPLLCPEPECNRLIFSASVAVWSGPQCEPGLACPYCRTFIEESDFYAQHFYAQDHEALSQDEREDEKKKYLAFDLEISKEIPEGETDWKAHRPFGITCAAAASSDGGLWNWWAQDDNGKFTDKMSESQCWSLVQTLNRLIHQGYTLLSWNGLGFDFDVLREESADDMNFCRDLALNHIDMMTHFFCSKGFPLGLDAAAKGMGLPGKPPGMTGAIAPQLWANGEYHRVLDYVSWDVKNTLGVAEAVETAGRLNWTARSGRLNSWDCPRWLTVKEALALPEPDTSWMDAPWALLSRLIRGGFFLLRLLDYGSTLCRYLFSGRPVGNKLSYLVL